MTSYYSGPLPPRQRLLQVWQYDGWGFNDVLDIAKTHGFTGVLVKAMDGNNWMATFDAAPSALRSLSLMQRQRELARNEGLSYYAWCIPLWEDRVSTPEIYGKIANDCDGLFLDVEPFPRFWRAYHLEGAADAFMQAVRAVAPSAKIVLQPDPRSPHLNGIRSQEWIRYCDGFSGQHYFPTFGTSPQDEVDRVIGIQEVLLNKPLGYMIPTLPLDAPPDQLEEMVSLLTAFGIHSWVAWRLGTGDNTTLDILGKDRFPNVTQSQLDEIDAIAAILDAYGATFDRLSKAIVDIGYNFEDTAFSRMAEEHRGLADRVRGIRDLGDK